MKSIAWHHHCSSFLFCASFFLLQLLNSTEAALSIPMKPNPSSLKVAVIGGGAAGLAAARVLSKHGIRPILLEKKTQTGGVWNYSRKTQSEKKDHPMYRGLRTNLPKEIMAFREIPWTRASVECSYVTHRDVLDYLRDYERIFDLTQYISFGCTVTQLTALSNSRSAIQLPQSNNDDNDDDDVDVDEIWPQIQLEWHRQDSDSNDEPLSQSCQDVFDAVIVCNGHYALPSTPRLPGLADYFVGNVMHSIEYDDPSEFTSQSVLCVGGRASGSDLAREISQYADHVYLSDTSCSSQQSFQNVTLVPKTQSILETGEVSFEGITGLHPKVDTIIFCSGYDYDFPFINQESNLLLECGRGERRVKPLFEQLWHAVAPNMAFIGLPHSILPFPLFEFQVQAVVHQWTLEKRTATTSDTLHLPRLPNRLRQAERDAYSGGAKPDGRVPNDTHYLGSAQWDYCRRLARYSGSFDAETELYISTNKAIYDHSSHERKSLFPGGPDLYRATSYRRDENCSSFVIVSSSPIMTSPSPTALLVRR